MVASVIVFGFDQNVTFDLLGLDPCFIPLAFLRRVIDAKFAYFLLHFDYFARTVANLEVLIAYFIQAHLD